MKLARRRFLHLAATAAALPAAARIARAQNYPTRSARLVVGFAPGGATDVTARIVAQWLSERLGQSFIVENRTGAGSNIAAQAVVNSPPDGYTLLVVTGSNAVNATFYEKLPFNLLKDIAPVGGLVRYPLILVVNKAVPATTLGAFISHAKANAGRINMASYGAGTTGHLTGELFKTMAGLDMPHVPYRGESPALVDIVGGQVQTMFCTPPGGIGLIKAGEVRPLAVTTATRWEGLPDLPSVGEFVPGFQASSWSGVGVPRGTPPEIIEVLNREIDAGLANPTIKARFAELGTTPLRSTPADFGVLMADETEKWGKVVRAANIKAE